MRNLKKILALVLALVMSLSLVTMANADFSDAADIDYKEAVEVMAKIGVLEGADGKFDPKGTLTREQAAKILTYVVLGTDKAEKLTAAVAPFADVAANRWSAGAIAYCASEGIIAGVGDGLYNPTGKLTGAAFGKMLLVALGFDADKNGLVGDKWEVNTAKILVEEELHVDGLVLSNELTREQAAQLALNAVKYTATPDSYVVKAEDGTVVGEFDTMLDAALYAKILTDESETFTAESAAAKDTLLKKVFKVDCYENGTDAFKRPATVYDHADWDLTYADKADLTYTTAVKGGKIYTALGKPSTAAVTYYSNGNAANAGKPAGFAIASGNDVSVGGNGTLVEVYKTATGAYTVVAIDTFVTTIASHTDAVKDKDGDITTKEYVTLTKAFSWMSDVNFDTTDFTEADEDDHTVVLFTTTATEIQSVEAAKSEKLLPTWCNADSFKAAGTTYKYALNKAHTMSSADVAAKADKVVYFDNYGYVIEIDDPAAATPDYAYVLNYGSEGVMNGETTYYAKLLYTDATVATVKVSANASGLVNHIVSYAEGTGSNAGKIVLTDKGAAYDGDADSRITKNVASQHAGIFNSKTIFVVETIDDNDVATYTAYTGISKVPTLDADKIAGVKATGADNFVVFFAMDADHVSTDSSAKDVVYVVGDSKAAAYDVDKGTYYTYNAIVNGEIKTIEASVDSLGDTIYGSYTTNDKGLVSGATGLSGTGIVVITTGDDVTVKAADDVITLGSTKYVYSEKTAVYTVDADNVITEATIGALDAEASTRIVAYTTDSVLTMIVVEK